jgi:hypothetical protein
MSCKANLSHGDARDDRQVLVRIVDAKIRMRPLCLTCLLGVDGRTLAAVFRPDSLLYGKPQFPRRRQCFLYLDRSGSSA